RPTATRRVTVALALMASDADGVTAEAYAKLKEDHKKLSDKIEVWKAKVKGMSAVDKAKIKEQQEEIGDLTLQLKTVSTINKDKDAELAKLAADLAEGKDALRSATSAAQKVEKLQQKLAEMTDDNTQLQEQVEALKAVIKNETHVHSEKRQREHSEHESSVKRKQAEVVALRSRIAEMDKQAEALRAQRDGVTYLQTSPTEVTVLKRTTHGAVRWCLVTTTSLSPRWFEEDHLVTAFGKGTLQMPPTDAEQLETERSAQETSQVQSLRSSLKTLQHESDRAISQKNQETSMLLKRLEALQEQHSKVLLKQQQSDGVKRDAMKAEADAATTQKYLSQIAELENELSEAQAALKLAQKDNALLKSEFTQYKRHAQAALHRDHAEQVPLKASSEPEALQEKHTKLEEELQSVRDSLRGAEAKLETSSDLLKRTQRNLTEALQNAETAERDKHELSGKLKKLKASLEREKAAAASRTTEREADDVDSATAPLYEEIDDLKRKLEAAVKQKEAVQTKLTAAQSAIKSLTEDMKQRIAPADADAYERSYEEDTKRHYQHRNPHADHHPVPLEKEAPQDDPAENAHAEEAPSPHLDEGPAKQANGSIRLADSASDFNRGASLQKLSAGPTLSSSSLDALEGISGKGTSTFNFDDLVSAAEVGADRPGSRLEWAERKLKRTLVDLSHCRNELDVAKTAARDAASLRATVAELERSLARQDAARSMDYIKNTILQFCLAKHNDNVQSALVPLLSSLLQLNPKEIATLTATYPAA
ncbi:hypothetical protein DIPPA_10874, partial [Diplonema papillatum]